MNLVYLVAARLKWLELELQLFWFDSIWKQISFSWFKLISRPLSQLRILPCIHSWLYRGLWKWKVDLVLEVCSGSAALWAVRAVKGWWAGGDSALSSLFSELGIPLRALEDVLLENPGLPSGPTHLDNTHFCTNTPCERRQPIAPLRMEQEICSCKYRYCHIMSWTSAFLFCFSSILLSFSLFSCPSFAPAQLAAPFHSLPRELSSACQVYPLEGRVWTRGAFQVPVPLTFEWRQ